MSWLEKILTKTNINISSSRKASIPEGVWTKCTSCEEVLYSADLERNLEVCPKCNHHMRMKAPFASMVITMDLPVCSLHPLLYEKWEKVNTRAHRCPASTHGNIRAHLQRKLMLRYPSQSDYQLNGVAVY